jgi:hypothetical protein
MSSRKRLKIGWAVFALMLITNVLAVLQPDRIVAALAKRSPEVVYFAETEESIVALTIDDGPDPITTPKILDVLMQHDARATFFLITNRIPGNEEIVLRIVEENHELANHLTTDEPSIRSIPSTHRLHLRGSPHATSCGMFDLAQSSFYTIMGRVVNARPRPSPPYCQSSTAVASA